MKFRKLGRVFVPDGSDPLARAYAILPTPLLLGDVIRVFYASTDDDTVGRIFYVDLDFRNPRKIVGKSAGPVLDAGQSGAFDMHGVNPSSLVQRESELWLYYVGYQRGTDVPYTLFTGLAVSRDQGTTFERTSTIPVFGRTEDERFFRTAANVHRARSGFRAWYIGGNRWIEHKGKALPIYGLRHVLSSDGLNWGDRTTVLDPDESKGQIGFGRPYVMYSGTTYRMFLSVRTVDGYTVSHAVSKDGTLWETWQHNILPLSESGWDSEMSCYAAALEAAGEEFVFYNGNRFGRTGFGVAIREA